MARKKTPLDAVQFTRESAERIAGIVRAAELTPPQATPLTFEPYLEGRHPKQVRAAMFSGAWPIGSSKVVTFSNLPTATATVQNISWPITNNGYANEPCVVGRDGTSWYLVVPRLQTSTGVFVTSTQTATVASGFQTFAALTDISISAELDTNNCQIAIGKTLSTTEIRVVSGTAHSISIAGTATASFLRIRVP